MVMGLPDMESTEKGAPGDTQIIHFEQDLICIKITPLYLGTLNGNPLSSGNYGTMAWVIAREKVTLGPGNLP